jgi:hypothetical protein
MKFIAYLITSNGVDGKAPERIDFASDVEQERDEAFKALKPPNYYSKVERIVDQEQAVNQAKAKLNGLDKFLLGFPS